MSPEGPQGVIVHAMGEFVRGAWAPTFLQSLGLHAHAYVTPSGVVVLHTPPDQQGAHARGWNHYLGVEVLVPGRVDRLGELYRRMEVPDWATPEQWVATVDLVARWCRTYDLDPRRVLRHSDVDPAHKRDPGDGFMWDFFQLAIRERMNDRQRQDT